MSTSGQIPLVELVYVHADGVFQWSGVCLQPCTVGEILARSGVLDARPEIVGDQLAVGIWGTIATWQQPVRGGDRVEVYLPLLIDPKDARRRRAHKGAGQREKQEKN